MNRDVFTMATCGLATVTQSQRLKPFSLCATLVSCNVQLCLDVLGVVVVSMRDI